jgi:hypothetical protein
MYRSIKEYREESTLEGKQRMLALYPSPVLLMPNLAPKLLTPGSAGFKTTPDDPTAPSEIAGRPTPLVVNDTFVVIPLEKGKGHPFPERIGVGRTKGTDVTLADREVSKYHGYFSVIGGQWHFTDGGSSNGTFVRGERLKEMVATPLSDNTEIAFGARRYIFRTAAGFCDYLSR